MPLGHKRLFTCLQHRFCASHTSLMTLCFWLSLFIQYHGVNSVGGPLPPLNPSTAAASNARRIIDATSASFERVFTDLRNTSLLQREHVSQCLLDFSALFNMPGKNYFKAPKGLEAVDALGKPGSNILYGNTQMWGALDECLSIGEGLIQYWLVPINIIYVQQSPTAQPVPIWPLPITWGLCVPRSCDSSDLEYFINATNAFLHAIINETNLNIAANYDDVKITRSKSVPLNSSAVAMIVVCGVFIALALVGSTVEMGEKNIMLRNIKHFFLDHNQEESSERSPLIRANVSSSPKKILKYITAFSLFKNVKIILSTQQPQTTITSLNGIRVMSMFWVIVHHAKGACVSYYSTNFLYDFMLIEPRFANQPINSKAFAVDSFFLLSGGLVAYHTLHEMGKRRGRFPVITYYLHRYLRLTMVYAFVLFFWWALMGYLGNDPNWQHSTTCNKYWWTNLLYINNLYPWDTSKACMDWTWYLANDMQFYVLAPLLLIPLYYLYPLGLLLSAALIVATFITTGAIAGTHKFNPRHFSENQAEGMIEIYTKPYCRASPYIVGLVLGFLLYKKVQINLHWFVDWLIYCATWLMSAGCCFSVVYGLYSSWHGHTLTLAETVSFFMFSRFTWSVGVALMVFACHNGYGWIINDFLSMELWTPLSRITYSAYLVHPVVVNAISRTLPEPFTYTDYTMAVYIVAAVVLSYGAAGVVAVFVEFPLSNIENLVFKALGLYRRQSLRMDEDAAANNDANEAKSKASESKATASFSNK